ncbi:Sucrose phosphate synthase [Methylophaga frappieri]|uniref:sucrose-phosphate synthase n=1 Tax=Methylophaga frappieri (strain ATCC BAA-2434 / DSM 25690 / JAM7) TaxID=754477 RepID=I1YET3_METFJ|nr:HAD-IIB family hydrolase [Methylophaga frappieri]AFJ01426.1 Sucrose phosphate synthase [Methylophaga frappieri]
MTQPKKPLYIALISIHGLIRGDNLELGRDADTGGQTLYVLELAEALSKLPEVGKVELITRRVADPNVDEAYAQAQEHFNDKLSIVRIDAGPENYLPKEQLWEHLDSFADTLVRYFRQQPQLPALIHSHYADAGLVGAHVANQLGLPLVHTGHSLGRVKRRRLLAGGVDNTQLELLYNMTRRIEAEEITLATAEQVITSTHQEIEEQYELYDHYQPEKMRVIPPGTNITQFIPPRGDEQHTEFYADLTQSLTQPDKPLILALSRPDKRKNINALLTAYGEDKYLQQQANLLIIAGNRDDIADLDKGAQSVFKELLLTIDRYDLYGKVTMPKHHRRDQVPQIYRIAAASGGVFVNPALTEPFGLTLIEAAASGLPIVATEDGGPRDILANCHNGELIDPLEPETISQAISKLLSDKTYWQQCQQNGLDGVRANYSWEAHAKQYLQWVMPLASTVKPLSMPADVQPLSRVERALVTDLDLNLLGDDDALKTLMQLLRQHRKTTKFAIATGRRLDRALKLMKKHGIPEPDILITSSGTEICYAPKLTPDTAWQRHIDHHWQPRKVAELLDDLPGVSRQPKEEQSEFKISYYIDPQQTSLETVKSLLHREEQSVHVQLAFGQFLDIMPLRASKGMALRYVAERWQLPLEQIFVAGGSGADEDMMRGNMLSAVVANRHHEELSQLEDTSHIYFAEKPYAAGILEALTHYRFFELKAG